MSWLSLFSFFIIIFATLFYIIAAFIFGYFQPYYFCFWFCCCLLFYFWLCFFILEPLRYFSVLFSHIFLVFSWFWFHFATINFLSWFFYWSHHLIIVFDFAFICSHIYFIVVLFSSVFLVSLFFQAVFMISFFAVIFFTCCSFVHCAFCSSGFSFAFHLSVFINRQYLIRQVVFVRLSSDISVELFVVLFSIFVVFEVGVYFAFYHYLNLTLTIQHCFTLIQLLLFQPTWTENKQINLSTNKTKQPTYLSL